MPLAELTEFTSIAQAAPGFARPGYGLGVMVDPEHPGGFLVGHGGGGPGFAAAAFATLPQGVVAVVLTASDAEPAQETALRLLDEAVRS